MATLDSLKSILEKMGEQGRISPELLKAIYKGEKSIKIAEAEKERFNQNIDAFIHGKINEDQFKTIQQSKSKEMGKRRIGHAYRKKQVQLIKPISAKDVNKIWDRMPLLGYYRETLPSEFGAGLPFLGKQFLVVGLHFTRDLLPFLETCEELGLEPKSTHVFWKSYHYPFGQSMVAYLKKRKYNVRALQELEAALKEIEESASDLPVVVVEDGGYVVPLLHRSFPAILGRTIGAVEQTTRGIRNDREIDRVTIPVLSVAEADLKREIEPPHVADAVVSNIDKLISFERCRGSEVTLMGYGTIGKEIAQALKARGLDLTVYDARPARRVAAKDKGHRVAREPYIAVKDKFLIIGCSGETSISRKEILALKHGTYLVSATSDQKEIGIEDLRSLSRSQQPLIHHDTDKVIGTSFTISKGRPIAPPVVHLVADGYPVNFWETESMPDQVSDLILSLILVSTIELVLHSKSIAAGIHSDKVDELADRYKVPERYEQYYLP